MASGKYKVWQWGAPVGEGAMQSEYVGLSGVAKGNTNGMQNTVANEFICGQLGRVIGLPLPPSAIVEKNGEPFHVSLDFNLSGQSLPPADAQALVAAKPELAWGVVLFDVWILNGDRHNKNLSYDSTTSSLQLFDHSHAFLQGADPLNHLRAQAATLGIGGQCLAPHLAGFAGFQNWIDRIWQVPEYYIVDSLETATGFGLEAALVMDIAQFLVQRRLQLAKLVENNRGVFPKISDGDWNNQFAQGGTT